MKQLLLLIPLTLLITACNSLVKINVCYHAPYCGGKLPNETEAMGQIIPMENHGFLLTERSSGKTMKQPPKTKTFFTDSLGNWTGRMSTNKQFALTDLDKACDIDALKRKYPLNDSVNYAYLSEKEIIIWRNSNEGFFSVQKATKTPIFFLIERPCFVGSNPIIRYRGAKPR